MAFLRLTAVAPIAVAYLFGFAVLALCLVNIRQLKPCSGAFVGLAASQRDGFTGVLEGGPRVALTEVGLAEAYPQQRLARLYTYRPLQQ